MRAEIAAAAHWGRLVAAILLALGSARFAVGAVLFALQTRAPALPVVAGVSAQPVRSEPAPAPVAGGGGASLARGEPTRTTLSISAGAPRSEVWVNGSKRGNTPFLGEVSCKVGASLRIEVVPPRGAPLVYERECRPGNVVIDR